MSMSEARRVAGPRHVAKTWRARAAIRALTILGMVATSGAGCEVGDAVIRGSAPPQITDGTPAAAVLYVTGDPAVASRSGSLRMVPHGGSEEVVALKVEPGERIVAQVAAMPGDYIVTDSEGGCSIPISLVEGREADVVLRMATGQPCQIVMAGDHVTGELPHPWFGAVAVTLAGPAVPAAFLEVRSLDSPPNPAPSRVPADPDSSDRFYLAGLPQGHYEATITSNEGRIGSVIFEIGVGPQAEVSVRVQPQATP